MAAPTKKQAVLGVVAVLVLVILLVWMLYSPTASAAGKKKTTPDPNPPIPPPGPDVPIVVPPDPLAPKTTPTPGQYYAVKAGDSDSLIVKRAGHTNIHAAWTKQRDHALNQWIGKYTREGATEPQLALFHAFAARPGYEAQTWTWDTVRGNSGASKKWPVVYVPRLDEV